MVWKKDGAAVTDEAGKPLAFKNRVQLLRGPRYAALLGPSEVGQVQLVDSQDGDKVVVAQLQLAPAPGRQRG